jgi:hypothetical protein
VTTTDKMEKPLELVCRRKLEKFEGVGYKKPPMV